MEHKLFPRFTIPANVTLVALSSRPFGGKTKKCKALGALSKKFRHITVSQLIARHRSDPESDLSSHFHSAQEIEEQGLLQPTPPTIEAVRRELVKLADEAKRGAKESGDEEITIIVDGIPRLRDQATPLMSLSARKFVVVELELSREKSLACAEVPGSSREARSDDTHIKRRNDLFDNHTAPAIKALRKWNRQVVHSIDARAPVREQILRILRTMIWLNPLDLREMATHLNDPKHPTRILIDEIEGVKTRTPTPKHPRNLKRAKGVGKKKGKLLATNAVTA